VDFNAQNHIFIKINDNSHSIIFILCIQSFLVPSFASVFKAFYTTFTSKHFTNDEREDLVSSRCSNNVIFYCFYFVFLLWASVTFFMRKICKATSMTNKIKQNLLTFGQQVRTRVLTAISTVFKQQYFRGGIISVRAEFWTLRAPVFHIIARKFIVNLNI